MSSSSPEVLPPNTLLIVGAGPVGLILAITLAHHGTRSVILERNLTTTRYPKMDLTTARSLEIFRCLGLADGLRQRGVRPSFSFACLFSTGLNADQPVSSWALPSVDEARAQIAVCNDGTMPSQPWQRISQEVFEAWLKQLCEENPLVDVRAGHEVTSAREDDDGAEVTVAGAATGVEALVRSAFVIACDGANSALRKSLGIQLEGGPLPAKALLVHFKSRDLAKLHKQGQFWHIFFPNEAAVGGSIKGAIIAQDEIDTWTVHCFLAADFDDEQLSSEQAVYNVLGGIGEPFPINIDQIIVRSTWTPSVAIAKNYIGPKGRILLAGDACHQTVPTGGYGMNTGIADAFDLGWKLAAITQKWGGPQLLQSYEDERHPVGMLSLHWSKIHMGNLMALSKTIDLDASTIASNDKDGAQMREALHEYVQSKDGHNKSIGVEMGYRYDSSICVPSQLDSGKSPPDFDPRKYSPTTCPGFRAPHVFLTKGHSIFDEFGKGFTLVSFSRDARASAASVEAFQSAARQRRVPLDTIHLYHEAHARSVWGADFVLVRPDNFVSWHSNLPFTKVAEATDVLDRATGFA